MIFSFNEFINESILTQLIMEGKIQYSPQFIQTLKNTQTEIGKTLISLFNTDVDSSHNYIDIAPNSEDSVTFISDNKIKQILGTEPFLYRIESEGGRLSNSEKNQHIYDRLGFPRPTEITRLNPGTSGKILGETVGGSGDIYVLFEAEDGRKTILNKKSLRLIDDRELKLWTTNRNPVKIGRVAQSLLTAAGKPFTQQDIEKFVNAYKATIKVMNDAFSHFDIVKGQDIIEFYETSRYASESGTLGNSCMANGGSWLDIYANNPNISMVILYDKNGKIENGKYKSDHILGRAILWELDSDSSIGPMFMDRVYTINDSDVDLFKRYAEMNGWWYKSSQSSGYNFTAVSKNETRNEPLLRVSLSSIPGEFPYLDTICYLDKDGKILHNNEDGDWDYFLNGTDGDYIDRESYED
jgi:hypothetical protein